MADDIAWLIERADPAHPGCVLGGHFLGFSGHRFARSGGELAWMSDAAHALRFARHDDAEAFIAAMEAIQDRLPYRDTLPGLRSGDLRAIAVEHAWCRT